MSEQVPAERISRVVRAYFLAIRAMHADALASTFAKDGTTYDPVGSEGVTGREAIRQFFNSIYKNFKSVAFNRRFDFRSRQWRGRKMDGRETSANGKSVNFEGIDVIEVNADGKTSKCAGVLESAEMIVQL